MKTLTMLICALLMLGVLAGCNGGEPFVGGLVTGATGMKVWLDEKNEEFIAAVNEIDARTDEINSALELYDSEGKDEIMAAIAELKKRVDTKDPVVWVAIASVLANALWGGTAIGKRKTGGTP